MTVIRCKRCGQVIPSGRNAVAAKIGVAGSTMLQWERDSLLPRYHERWSSKQKAAYEVLGSMIHTARLGFTVAALKKMDALRKILLVDPTPELLALPASCFPDVTRRWREGEEYKIIHLGNMRAYPYVREAQWHGTLKDMTRSGSEPTMSNGIVLAYSTPFDPLYHQGGTDDTGVGRFWWFRDDDPYDDFPDSWPSEAVLGKSVCVGRPSMHPDGSWYKCSGWWDHQQAMVGAHA